MSLAPTQEGYSIQAEAHMILNKFSKCWERKIIMQCNLLKEKENRITFRVVWVVKWSFICLQHVSKI